MNKTKRYSLQKKVSVFDSTASTFNSKKKQIPRVSPLRKNFSVSIKSSAENSSLSSENCESYSKNRVTLSSSPMNRHYWHSSTLYSSIKIPTAISPLQFHCSSMCSMFRDNNQVFLEKNKDQKRQIASLTKIMTAFTAINICNTYGIKIRDTYVTVEKQASAMQGTSANLRRGDRLLIIDLLYGMLLPSGNDAALALAQYLGKFLSFIFANKKTELVVTNEENIHQFEDLKEFYDNCYGQQSTKLFVFEMNKNCQRIGLKSTKFSNPTGLTDNRNYSTAYQMCKLISFCLNNHMLRSIFKKKVYTCTVNNDKMGSNRLVEWRNTNKHLFLIKNCIGVKTGITPGAGPCLSSAYRVNGRQLVVIILNSRNLQERYMQAQRIYTHAKSDFGQSHTDQHF